MQVILCLIQVILCYIQVDIIHKLDYLSWYEKPCNEKY